VEKQTPVVDITVIHSVPNEMAFITIVSRKRKEERRAIETVFLTKLHELSGRCLFTQHSDSRVTWYQFN
jgi:hypothetical protein